MVVPASALIWTDLKFLNGSKSLSSSKFSANWRATATYVGMDVEECGHVIECILLCAWHFLFLLYFVSQ